VNTANLATNYAALLNDAGELSKAKKTLKGKLEILEKRHGAQSWELVPMLVELGRANLKPKTQQVALDYFERASDLAEGHDNPLFVGQQNFDIASALMKGGNYQRSEPFMARAHQVYVQRLQPTDMRLGLTSYQMAIWAVSRRHYDEAAKFLNGSLAAFKMDDGPMGDLERTVRYRLVETYELMGMSEAATEHCIAVGAHQEWSLPPSPLFGVQANYPVQAAESKLSGEVSLVFAVDANGFVTDAAVAKSSDPVFDDAALEMIQKYRFAPRFEGGEPVATPGVRFTASFDLAAAKSGSFNADFQRPGLPGFSQPRFDDPSVCGDPTDNSGRCQAFPIGK
jgi:TonB family protein